jgi:carboxyl-terminal processing protease
LGTVSGIIFDVRGNAGGEIEGMPNLFLKERSPLYISRSRAGETKVFVDPAVDALKGPLVLLVDRLTGSAGRLFPACLQAIGRAVVVGERREFVPGERCSLSSPQRGSQRPTLHPIERKDSP